MRYVKPLDGLRAVGAISVFLFHTNERFTWGGFLGVDIFFVLSGFLITSILLKEIEIRGGVEVLAFYRARFLRLWPALATCLVVLAPFHALLAVPGTPFGYLRAALAAATYTQDIWSGIFSFHWGEFAHTWSLAVEWQFYLAWPAVVIAMRSRRRQLGILSLGMAAGMMVLFIIDLPHTSEFFAPHTRGVGLLVGCALGAFGPDVQRHLSRLPVSRISNMAFAALLAWLIFNSIVPGAVPPAVKILATCIFSATLIATLSTSCEGIASTLLSSRVMRWAGQVSYAFYLLHIPIIVIVTHFGLASLGNHVTNVIAFAISLGLASCLRFSVEEYFMNRRKRVVKHADGVLVGRMAVNLSETQSRVLP